MRGVVVICGWLVDGLVDGVCMLPSQATDALDKSRSCPSRAHSRTTAQSSILLAPPSSHMLPTESAFYHHCLIPTIVFPLKPRLVCTIGLYSSANCQLPMPHDQPTVFCKYRMS